MSSFPKCDLNSFGDSRWNVVINWFEKRKGFFNVCSRIQCSDGTRGNSFFPLMTLSFECRVFFLDMSRISNLLGMVAGSDFGQIFITDSNKVRMSGIVDGLTADRAYFEAVGGEFREI